MHSFYDFSYILKLPIKNITRLLNKGFEKREERKAWDMWIVKYQSMEKNTFTPFSEFYKKATLTDVSQRSTEEILKEVAEIRQRANPQTG